MPTHSVAGNVVFDGQPVPDGEVLFIDPQGSVPPASGKIKDGKYTAQVPAGKKRIEIRASKMMPLPEGRKGAMGETEMPQEYLPAKYNAQTELTYEVTSGTNAKDFELTP